MTNAEYRFAIKRLGLSQGGAAKLLCIHKRTSCGFANDRAVPDIYARFLRLMISTGTRAEDVK